MAESSCCTVEDLGSVSRTLRWVTSVYNSSSRASETLSDFCQHYGHVIHTYRQATHTHTQRSHLRKLSQIWMLARFHMVLLGKHCGNFYFRLKLKVWLKVVRDGFPVRNDLQVNRLVNHLGFKILYGTCSRIISGDCFSLCQRFSSENNSHSGGGAGWSPQEISSAPHVGELLLPPSLPRPNMVYTIVERTAARREASSPKCQGCGGGRIILYLHRWDHSVYVWKTAEGWWGTINIRSTIVSPAMACSILEGQEQNIATGITKELD